MRLFTRGAGFSCLAFSSDGATRACPGRAKFLMDSPPYRNLMSHSTTVVWEEL